MTLEVPKGHWYIGGSIDRESGKRTDAALLLDSARLTTHGVIVGMTGSGKTGLGVVLLEEALLSGTPTLVIDPKGDMGNLALRFPELRGEDFRPWIDEAAARREGVEPDAHAAKVAAEWKQGLGDWQIDEQRFAALSAAGDVRIYTPGSSAGAPLSLLGSPVSARTQDLESVRDEIEAYVSGLLALADIEADPLSSPEHVLLSTLLEHAWRGGRSLDLASLVLELQDPPVRKLGVFDVDRFFPKKDRNKLAMKLNALLASPSFASWLEGDPLDVASLLYGPNGKPRCAILYLQHLSDAERMLVVTLTLSKLVTWMRSQPGTSGLRALVYMDEVFGYAPPTAAPPSKKPILTLLKQARAFGVGLVLATQNPVDLDYKALSNAGTWLVGRLQTERDRERMVQGLESALGITDASDLTKLIAGLGKRQYVLHQVGHAPALFTSRWCMSYLRGPLTREEVRRLARPASDLGAPTAEAAPAPAAPAESPPAAAPPARAEQVPPAGSPAAPAHPQQQYPQQAHAQQQYPQQAYPQQQYPQQAYPHHAYPQQAYPQQAYPPQAYPQQAYPPQAYPPQAYPQHAYPPQAYPQQAYPPQAYPPQAYLQQAYPQQAYPQHVYPSYYAQPSAPRGAVAPAPVVAPAAVAAAPHTAESPPPAAPGFPVRFADPGAPWLLSVGATPAGARLAPALVATVELRFDERKLALDHREEYEVVLFPLGGTFEASRLCAVDHDPRDFRDVPPPGRTFWDPGLPLQDVTWLERMKSALAAHLLAARTLALFHNATLGLCSRPGEDRATFDARCRYEADQRADAEAEKLRDKFAARVEKARDAIQRAQISAADARADAAMRQQQTYLQGAGALVSMFMGGRSGVRGLAGLASRQVGLSREGRRVAQADQRIQGKASELERLEQDLAAAIAEISARWERAALDVASLEVGLEADDIHVRELFVAWLPVG